MLAFRPMRRVCLLLALAALLAASGCGGGGGGKPTTAVNTDSREAFARLEARPVHLPHKCIGVGVIALPGMPPEAAVGPFNDRRRNSPRQTARLEHGPVYVEAPHYPPRIWYFALPDVTDIPGPWRAVQTLWISRPSYDGAVLVRGRRLDGSGTVGFGAGKQPRPELRLPPGPWATPSAQWKVGRIVNEGAPDARQGWRVQSVETRVRAPGCYAYQVDGEGFSYHLAFAAVGSRWGG
jgi:hypothetical protein